MSVNPFDLREYQKFAIAEMERMVRSNVRRFIAQSPTGSGKTLLATELITRGLRKGSKFLFLAHRHELLKQPYKKLKEMGVPESELSIIKSGEESFLRPFAPVQIASAQSLRSKTTVPPANVVFVDECHLSHAKTFLDIIAKYQGSVIIGLTATPTRLDGKCLGDIYEEIIVVAQPMELARQGWIVKPDVYTVPSDQLPDVTMVKRLGGDFNQKALGIAVNKRKLVGSIVDHWLHRAQGKRTICFATTIEHSLAIVEEFKAHNVRAMHVDGTTSKEDRAKALVMLANHEIDVLCNCQLYVEGLDVPEIKCVILARPTESLTIYLQSVGRGVRPWEGEQFIVLDHAGNAMRHGSPMLDRIYDLNPAPKSKRASAAPDPFATRTCGNCFKVIDVSEITNNRCPNCGEPFPVADRSVETVEGTLILQDDQDPDLERRGFYARLWAKAYGEGHDAGWVNGKFRDRFGELPTADYSPPPRPNIQYTDEQKTKDLLIWQGIAHRNNFPVDWIARRYRAKFNEEIPNDTPADRINGPAPPSLPPEPPKPVVTIEGEF